jgi:hypothetical protein
VENRRRIILLIAIMAVIVAIVEAVSVNNLYRTALTEEMARLREAAASQARLIEAIARFDQAYSADFPGGSRAATLEQVRDAHSRYTFFGGSGEIVLAVRRDDAIVFLMRHQHADMDEPAPVPWDSDWAEPMRRALSGESGVFVGLDYEGRQVLAAHEPVGELGMGIVTKIELDEVRAPFVRAAVRSATVAAVLIVLGSILFVLVTNPLMRRLQESVTGLEKALAEVRTLEGILPICSYCKKIRKDDGEWDAVDVYIAMRSEADFSHSICPGCMQEHFPEIPRS